MKKFSKITGAKVNSEPKAVDFTDENTSLKANIRKLIKEFLHIRIYGPIDPILEGTIKIEGEDAFINSIIDLFEEQEVNEKLDLLKDTKFKGLDNVIEQYENKLLEKQTKSQIEKHKKRIRDLIRRSKGDKEEIKKLAKSQAKRIKDGEKCFYRGLAAENMVGRKDISDEALREVSDIFIHRSKKLGYRR